MPARAGGIFPNDEAVIRPVGALLPELDGERAVRRARYTAVETIAPMSDDPAAGLPAVAS